MSKYSHFSKKIDNTVTFVTNQSLSEADNLLMENTPDKGLHVKRIKYNPLEESLARLWAEECKPVSWLNYGMGLVQDLFVFIDKSWPYRAKKVMWLTKRERMVAATCIQWLGTNCGRAFLDKALEDCGYKIVKIKND